MIDIKTVKINYGTIEDLIPGENSTDSGNSDDGGSTATLVDERFIGTPFTDGAVLLGSITVDDLERGETVILRIDDKLGCKPGSQPTGNLQADLQSAWLIAIGAGAVNPPSAISGGAQTVPFKQVNNLGAADIAIVKTVRVAGTADNYTDAFTGTYWLTQADIDAGTFTNVATVTGTPPIGPNVTDTDDDTQNFTRSPAIQLEKTGTYVDFNANGIFNAGTRSPMHSRCGKSAM